MLFAKQETMAESSTSQGETCRTEAIRQTDGSIHKGLTIRTLLSSSTAAKAEAMSESVRVSRRLQRADSTG